MKSICVSSSRKFYDRVRALKVELDKLNVIASYPNFKYFNDSAENNEVIKRDLTLDFFPKIEKSDVLYIVATGGYTGTSVTMEAAFAYAKGKEIISSELVTDLSLRSIISRTLTEKEFVNYLASE